MSATMNSPNEDIAAAAIANDQTAQVDLPNESAAADDQDIPVTTRDSEVTHNKDAESSGDPEQEINANDRSRVSQLDTLIETCDQLTDQMGVLLFQLQRLICRRAAFRDKSLQPSIHTMEISSVSWTRMRLFNSKLSIEKNWSEGLSTIQARYKNIIHDVQTTLDIHKSLQETSAYQTKPDIRLRANAAVVDLEENSASFDRRVRRILHAVFLTDKEARRYTWTL